MTLKEQSTIIDRLQKENFDLKIKVFYLNDKLEKQSDEGVKEMMKENVDMKVKLAEGMRERKSLKRRIKELEKKIQEMGGEKEGKEDGEDNITELWELKERVERYEVEIEELSRREKEREDRMREEISRKGVVGGERAEEVAMLREFLETETTRREKVDMENRRLREEIWRMKNESCGQPHLSSHHSVSARHSSTRSLSERDRDESRERGLMNQLRVENDELRREVGAQTSMLTSRNREKDRLYQEIEDLKLHLRNGGGAALAIVAEHDQHQQHQNRAASVISDRILDRSVSRAGGAASVAGTHVSMLSESEREDFENANGQLRDRISELRLKNQELQIQIENCYREIDQKADDMERVAVEYEEELQLAHAEVQEMQAERNDALRMREEIEMDFDQLKEEAEEEIQKLEEELDIRLGDVEKLEEDVRCKDEDFKGLQQEMRNVSDIVVRLEDVHEEHAGEVRRLEEKLEGLQRTLRENEQEMSVLEGSLREANEKIERMTVQSESAKGEIAFLREEQDADKIKIGELEMVIKGLEKTIEEEKERVADARERLESERKDREKMGDKRYQEWERKVNEKSQEVMNAKDEVRRLRSKVSNREEEAKQWRERLEELERALREALGDLSGTRTGLFKSIVNLQSELESTLEELDYTKNELVEKDRVLKDRENLLEGMALESRKLTDLLDKERAGRKSDRAALETLKTTHHQTRHTITQHQTQYTELEKTRNKESKSIHQLEQQYREQLAERNNLLTQIWLRLSALCGPDWTHRNSLVPTGTNNVNGKQSMEAAVVGTLPGFQKNMLIAVKTIESIVAGFKTRCRGVERDLWKEYQVVENALESRTRRLERLESLVRGGIGEQNGMRTEVAKLRTENRLLRAELNVVKNEASSTTATITTSAMSSSQQTPPILHRSKTSAAVPQQPPKGKETSAPTSTAITRTSSTTSTPQPTDTQDVSEKRWILRLRELEKRLKAEREARLLDRSAAKKKVEEARGASAEYKAELERERAVSGSKR
ncbi:hypothetical protein C7212DRAFT_285963 [Tuber magnatum]|uniref:Centrosomin N-terminal motif 1 domain-containing protein n=1 Tax=Tuber magnatum TaxID=42249 RepID=A0A317SFN9_9PEZI|nr:hypothetical protein C7212DRAFT_285963 [Tuber magnatum]